MSAPMNLTVKPAAVFEQPALAMLLQLYLREFAAFTKIDTDAEGHYRYPYLAHYWRDPARFPFLLRHRDNIAGFALVRQETDPADGSQQMDMAEFFILPEQRRQRLGERAAQSIFALFPGPWQVRVLLANKPAEPFWRHCIAATTEGQFEEHIDASSRIFRFQFLSER